MREWRRRFDDTEMSSDHDANDVHAHDAAHGHDEHGHTADALGPIDWSMWGAGVLGVIAAVAVLAGFVLAAKFAFNA